MGATGYPFTPNTGNDFAGFLLGSVVTANSNTTLATWLPKWTSPSLYFQDDWVVNRRLALNLGLRWSYESPYATKHGQESNFDPTGTDLLTGLPGCNRASDRKVARSDYKHFQPRIGVAYKVTNKGVFRAGFAVNTINLFVTAVGQNFDEYTSNVVFRRVRWGTRVRNFSYRRGPARSTTTSFPMGPLLTWAQTIAPEPPPPIAYLGGGP